jgi:hypothetical protein
MAVVRISTRTARRRASSRRPSLLRASGVGAALDEAVLLECLDLTADGGDVELEAAGQVRETRLAGIVEADEHRVAGAVDADPTGGALAAVAGAVESLAHHADGVLDLGQQLLVVEGRAGGHLLTLC